MDIEDFKCLVCGEENPNKYACSSGFHGHIYDTSIDNYFVRMDKAETLHERYKGIAERLLLAEKERVQKEIEDKILKEEFRKILSADLLPKVDEEFKYNVENFNAFLSWFGKQFERGIPQPRYSVSSPCMKNVLKNVKRLGKAKYRIEAGDEKILRCKAMLDENKLSRTFPFVSNSFGLGFLDTSNDYMILEFAHFSEFPLSQKDLPRSNRDIFG